MAFCNICLGAIRTPAALPCGHVFCHDCILNVVRSVRPFTTQHRCPVCREKYTIELLLRESVPDSLRLHVTPSIRKLNIDLSGTQPAPSEGLARHQAEILSLRAQRAELHRRVELSSAAAAGLCCLAKKARDHALRMQTERDALVRECNRLKRKLREHDTDTDSSSSSASSTQISCPSIASTSCLIGSAASGHPPLPKRLKWEANVDILPPSISRRLTPRLPVKREPASPALDETLPPT